MENYSVQKLWGWKVAAYLFLGGVAGGAYSLGFLMTIYIGDPLIEQAGLTIGLLSIGIGVVFLIADLGVKHRAFFVFRQVRRSWMARGAWIITIFAALSIILIALFIVGKRPADYLALRAGNAVLGVAVMTYTGVLLKQSRSITSWNTWWLVAVFVVSASSTGVMSLILLILLYSSILGGDATHAILVSLSQLDVGLILVEGIVVGGYLRSIGSSTAGMAARRMLLNGSLAREFWGFFIVCGLTIPVLAEITHVTVGLARVGLAIAMMAGLFGGLVLRGIVLRSGVNEPHRLKDVELSYPDRSARA